MSDAIEAALVAWRQVIGLSDGQYLPVTRYDKAQDGSVTDILIPFGDTMMGAMRAALTAYEAAKGGGVDASFPTALSDSEVRIWINACNHEPARQALRQLLAYRVRGVSSALTSPASGERDAPAGYVLAPVEPTPEMLRAGMDDLGWWVEPYEAPRESGVPIDSDMSAEDAAVINAQQIEVVASCYRAMLAAALRMEGK